MTAKELSEFLQTLSDEDLDMDVEIVSSSKRNHVFLEGVSVDCNGVYLLDDNATKEASEALVSGVDILFTEEGVIR